MAPNPRANVARRQAEDNPAGPRAWMHVLLTSFLTVTLFGLAGCDKPPTWSELIGKKKEEAPAPAPVVKQAEPTKAAPAPAPKQPEAPKKTAQEAMAQFNSTPVYRRTNEQLAELASFPEVRDQITNLDIQSKRSQRRRVCGTAQVRPRRATEHQHAQLRQRGARQRRQDEKRHLTLDGQGRRRTRTATRGWAISSK